jgi:hypothetical protein
VAELLLDPLDRLLEREREGSLRVLVVERIPCTV